MTEAATVQAMDMPKYPKIDTVWERNPEDNYKSLLGGHFARPEFQFLADCEWEWTEKVDGTNIRVGWDGERFEFRGKSDRAQIPAHLVDQLNRLFVESNRREWFEEQFPDGDVVLFGEGYGNKIQKAGKLYNPDDADFVLFDINIGGWWLERENVEDIAEKLGLDVVPVVGHGSLHDMVEMVREGFTSQWGDFTAEGLVARPRVELRTRHGERLITKVKHKDFPLV